MYFWLVVLQYFYTVVLVIFWRCSCGDDVGSESSCRSLDTWPFTQEEESRSESQIPLPHWKPLESKQRLQDPGPWRAAVCSVCVGTKPTSWSGSRASGSAPWSGFWTQPFCCSSGEWTLRSISAPASAAAAGGSGSGCWLQNIHLLSSR